MKEKYTVVVKNMLTLISYLFSAKKPCYNTDIIAKHKFTKGSGQVFLSSFSLTVSCPTLTVDTNGVSDTSSNGTVTLAVYECAVGFALIGDSELACMANGSWSSSEPTCGRYQIRWILVELSTILCRIYGCTDFQFLQYANKLPLN